MPEAVGVIETMGFPPVLASADAMVKAAQVTLVYYGLAEGARHIVAIRGSISEVTPAVEAGVEAGNKVKDGTVLTHYIVPNPPENVVAVLPIDYTRVSAPFRGR
jgi:microcompartment protein CcmL/EutN